MKVKAPAGMVLHGRHSMLVSKFCLHPRSVKLALLAMDLNPFPKRFRYSRRESTVDDIDMLFDSYNKEMKMLWNEE
ncbi:hypothetical protein Tco_0853641 [Tanacetum coccineum]